jgi:hypothetical protein
MLGSVKQENIKTRNGIAKIVSVERCMKMSKFATKIKQLQNDKILWEVFPRIDGNKYVITSASDVGPSGPETYVFPSNEKGEIIDWGELPGSYRGDLVHEKCFKNIGYKINE